VELSPATFQIRFNTEALKEPDRDLPVWRVLENGHERLARHVKILVESWTSTDCLESGIIKHHITCVGVAHWENDELSICDA
jgi:hypothetical protein